MSNELITYYLSPISYLLSPIPYSLFPIPYPLVTNYYWFPYLVGFLGER
jgi:hypothetical protein